MLIEHGAAPPDLDPLLAFCDCRLTPATSVEESLPLADEPHIAAWAEYAKEAAHLGAWPALRARLVQFNFPVRAGISSESEYRAATLRGVLPAAAARSELQLTRPDRLRILVHRSIGGGVPVLVTGERGDFEFLVQALTARGEPRPVPSSMGACLVSGLNNWDRIHAHRRAWETATGTTGNETAWNEEFARFRQSKAQYQDRLILLSQGPYSGVAGQNLELSDKEWLELSHRIRLEHECTHYFTLRVFGKLQHNIVEELVADYAGLVSACGRYRANLAARFLGLEDFPRYRRGGRLENYCGQPPLSEELFVVIQRLTHGAIMNLDQIDSARAPRDSESLARLVVELVQLTLEELAGENLEERLSAGSNAHSRLPSKS